MDDLLHVAIIMDGNGRWAKSRNLPRVSGHIEGVERVKEIIDHSLKISLQYLTLFAFSRDNWQRPLEEVSFLMNLLLTSIQKELHNLNSSGVKIRFIGNKSKLDVLMLEQIEKIQHLTQHNNILFLDVAVDYSGTYDIIQAMKTIILKDQSIEEKELEELLNANLLTAPHPNPDLLIRTSGETRLSNFMLWQLAYTECYFIDTLWPDFNIASFKKAIKWFYTRERRFGTIKC